jgi:exodeoxyribonuclease VII large subunit
MDGRILTVADFLALVNETLGMIPSEAIVIEGEVAEYSVSHGKWINFALKDEKAEAKIPCFATSFQIKVPIENGLRVQVQGYPKIYEKFGKFSLNVNRLELVGEGALAKAYEALKKRLSDEGLFEASRKRQLPRFPKRIGLITSTEAAAYGDFMRILNNRWSGVEVMVAPVHVQGQYAPSEIIAAFEAFERLSSEERPEVIVLTRGGGSLEDLHAFNDEQVARAVFRSSIPVICGVGHERDESLCDYVADVRASTPSNAAQRVVPDRAEVAREIEVSTRRLEEVLRLKIERRRGRVEHTVNVLERFINQKTHDLKITIERFGHAFDRFRLSLLSTRQYIERGEEIVTQAFLTIFERAKQKTQALVRLFESFDVQKVLDRGYGIVRSGNQIVRDATKLAPGQLIKLQLARGTVEAEVAGKPKQTKLL